MQSAQDIVGNLDTGIFSDAVAREWLLRKIYSAPVCPHCGAGVSDSAKFWKCQRLNCPACQAHFTARTGTFLDNAKMPCSDMVALVLMIELGHTNERIAGILGKSLRTIQYWRSEMNAVIYKPKGRALEYAKLALNPYNGCTHGCIYCYAARFNKEKYFADAAPKLDFISKLRSQIGRMNPETTPEILISFLGDPYQPAEMELGITREMIKIFIAKGFRFTLLTKGGLRASRDFDLLAGYPKARFGTSLTVFSKLTGQYEPNAAHSDDRVRAIREAKDLGIPTWVSLEPVIFPEYVFWMIQQYHDIVDHWKVGKINGFPELEKTVDWLKFRSDVTKLLNSVGANYYLKKSLTDL